MISDTLKKLVGLIVNDNIAVKVTKVDTGSLDSNNIIEIVAEVENKVYQIRTKKGLSRVSFLVLKWKNLGSETLKFSDVSIRNLITLRKVAAHQSMS